MADQLFTPAEIKELVAKGVLNDSNKGKLTPPELDMYNQAYNEDFIKKHQAGGKSLFGGEADLQPSVDWGTIAGAALPWAGEIAPVVGKAAAGTWDAAKLAGGMYGVHKLLDMVNAPADVKNAIMIALGLKGMGGGGGKPNRTSEAAPASIPAGAQIDAKYGAKIQPDNVFRQRTNDPLDLEGDIRSRVVNGGVQNDFRGPVTFRGQSPILQRPGESDILENVLGTARNGWEDGRGTPLAYGPASDPEVAAVQRAIAEALDGGLGASRPAVTRLRRP